MKTLFKILFISIIFVSCNRSRYEMFTVEHRTTAENREYVWNYHYDDYDSEYIGYCYWWNTRCANSGGGWRISLVFKDKSYGDYLLPQNSPILPNSNCTTNEYTTDRFDIRNLTKLK